MKQYNDELPDILGRIGGELILGRRGLGRRTYLYEQRIGALGYVTTQYDPPLGAAYQTRLNDWRGVYR